MGIEAGTLILFLSFFLILSCNEKEEKPKVIYEEAPKEVVAKKDTTQIRVADLPVFMNGTSYFIHPVGELRIYDIKSKSICKSFSDKSCNKNNLINSIKSKNSSSNKYDELSLLEDDYFICAEKNSNTSKNNFLDYNSNSVTNKLITKTIGSEFQNIFTINDNLKKINKINKNESSEIKDTL